MISKIFKIFSLVLVFTLFLGGLQLAFSEPTVVSAAALPVGGEQETEQGERGSEQGGGARGSKQGGGSQTPLTEAEKAGLEKALLEEYAALNLYTAIIKEFEVTIPFEEIARSEQKHADTLIRQMTKFGLPVLPNSGQADLTAITSLEEAYAAGVAFEIADAALYDELKLDTTNSALLRVYSNLQRASLESHLPTFQSYLE